MQPCAADETGEHVAFGWMTNQPGGFVDHQQFFIVVDDGEHAVSLVELESTVAEGSSVF